MIEHLLELLVLLGPLPFLIGQIQIDELFFDLVVKGGPGAQAQIQRFTGALKATGPAGDTAAKGTDRFTKSSTRAAAASAGLGKVLTRLVGIFGGLFIIRRIVGDMVKFQTTMAEVATIADKATVDVDELTRGVLALARESPTSADELGAAAYQILSAGVQNTTDVFIVLEASQRAAVAGLTSTEVAADALTTVINAFGLEASEANRVADVLFKTVELGKIRFEEISATIGNAATSAGLAGVSIEELAAGIVALTRVGIGAAEATSSLNRLFLTLTQQSKEQEQAFRDLGIEFNITTVAEKGFAGLLEEVNKLTGANIDLLSKLFPNIRAARSAFVIAGQGADLFTSSLEELLKAQGSVDAAFEILNRTAINQARILRNNVIVTFQEIGLNVLPGAAKAFEFISFAIRNFVGTIKVLGAEAPVAFQRLVVAVESAGLSVIRFVADSIGAVDDLLEGIAQRLRIVADLPVPGAEIAGVVAAGFEAASRGADQLEGRIRSNIAAREELLEVERQELRFLEEGFQETVLLIAAEQEFLRTRNERAESIEASAKREQAARQLTKEQLEEREELEKEVLDEVAKATQTAAELQARAFVELGARVRKVFGEEIPDGVRDGLLKLADVVEEAVLEAAAMKLADGFREAIEESFAEIEFEAIDIAEPEERRLFILTQQTAVLEDQRREVEERLKATKTGTAEERALRAVLVDIVKLLGEAGDEQKDLAKDAARDAKDRARDLAVTLGLIQQAINGVTDLASQFGLVDDETAKIIDNMVQLGSALGTVVSQIGAAASDAASFTSILAGGIGVAGALAGLLGGILGGDISPEQQARERSLEENSRRLNELRQSVDRLKGQFDITGADFSQAQEDLESLEETLGFIGDIRITLDPEQLQALGVDLANLDRVAGELGITIRDEAGNIIPQALLDLQRALDAVQESLIGFPETIEGVFARLQAEFEIFDVEDPIEKFRRLQEALLDIQTLDASEVAAIFADESLSTIEKLMAVVAALKAAGAQVSPFIQELLAIDVDTPEGRKAADQLIRDLFQQLATGEITPEELGAATFDEAIQILLEMERLLDDIAETEEGAAGETEGQTQDIRRTVQITELQAGQLLAFQSTLVVRAEQRNALLQEILAVISGAAIEAPSPPAVPIDEPIIRFDPLVPPTVETQTFNVDVDIAEIVVGPGATPEDAEEAAEILVERISVELGEMLGNQDRTLGIRRT